MNPISGGFRNLHANADLAFLAVSVPDFKGPIGRRIAGGALMKDFVDELTGFVLALSGFVGHGAVDVLLLGEGRKCSEQEDTGQGKRR